jgi:hypothetical protein
MKFSFLFFKFRFQINLSDFNRIFRHMWTSIDSKRRGKVACGNAKCLIEMIDLIDAGNLCIFLSVDLIYLDTISSKLYSLDTYITHHWLNVTVVHTMQWEHR